MVDDTVCPPGTYPCGKCHNCRLNAAKSAQQPVGISDDKDTIIALQKHRIESLEQAIGLAKGDYYDKMRDGNLWEHPLMANLMAVLKEGGHTPMSKDTQICLVKAALRSMPERESVKPELEEAISNLHYLTVPYEAHASQLGAGVWQRLDDTKKMLMKALQQIEGGK